MNTYFVNTSIFLVNIYIFAGPARSKDCFVSDRVVMAKVDLVPVVVGTEISTLLLMAIIYKGMSKKKVSIKTMVQENELQVIIVMIPSS